ncbi:MAG: restriction endonuclease subunit S [Thiomicrospira sp.]|jgi:type I restriction enzyme S subunit|nr:restriction endonuclease subunit S [Thiomicrospira sp.]
MSEQTIPAGYKQTEVGMIPKDWEIFSLPEVIWYQEGPGLRKWQFKSKGLKVINVTNLQESGYLDLDRTDRHISWDEFEKTYKHFACDEGDLVIASSGNSYCKVSIVRSCDLPLLMNTSVIRFKPIGEFSKGYMEVYLKSPYFKDQIDLLITGGAQPNFGPAHLNLIKIPAPTCAKEQTAIANALSDVDALINEQEDLIAKKQAIKTATMQQLLTGKTRLPPFAHHPDGTPKRTQQTELGEIPEDWGCVCINELITDLRGGAPFKPSDFTKDGIKVLPKGGVVRGGVLQISEADQQFCSPQFANKYLKNWVNEKYTIVVLRDLVPSGPSIGLMVKIPVPEKYILAQGVYGFLAVNESTSAYLIQYSNTNSYRRAANEIMVGSTQVHITNGAFKGLKITIPLCEEEQSAIAQILSDMDEEIQTLEQRLAKTRQIKQGMMQQLLTGKIRLVKGV